MMKFNAILFNIAEQCNIRCRHCGYADSLRTGLADPDELADWVTQAVDYGIPQIIFTGGEPFIRFDLLKRAIEAVYLRGGASGVFTNSLWGKTLESARSTLKQLPGLTHLYLSCDIYHLEFVPAEYIINVIQAARELLIPKVIICITYTNEKDKQAITDLFAGEADYVYFHYGLVIPSEKIEDIDPEDYDCMHEFMPDSFSSQCYLHTPLVNPNGTLATCHIGKVETHEEIVRATQYDLKPSPYYMGSLKEETIKEIFDRAEQNAAYQFLRVYGPKALVKIALASSAGEELKKERFSCDCHMCFHVLTRKEVYSDVKEHASEIQVQTGVLVKRAIMLGDSF